MKKEKKIVVYDTERYLTGMSFGIRNGKTYVTLLYEGVVSIKGADGKTYRFEIVEHSGKEIDNADPRCGKRVSQAKKLFDVFAAKLEKEESPQTKEK